MVNARFRLFVVVVGWGTDWVGTLSSVVAK